MKDLTIIIPTFNEKDNIFRVYEAIISKIKNNINWEIIFVDDNSSDGTFKEIEKVIAIDKRVRAILRPNRRGLSSAVIEGFLSSYSKFFLVMDGDMQHDQNKINLLYDSINENDLDIVIASRFMNKEKTKPKLKLRFKISKLLINFFSYFTKLKLNDPLSGFFIIKSDLIFTYHNRFSGISFKILLDIILSIGINKLKIKEVPSELNKRESEESKLDTRNMADFLFLIIDKYFGNLIPIRFIKFSLVGCTGVFVQLFFAYILMRFFYLNFYYSNLVSIIIATASNFYLNNYFTYFDKKLRGYNIIIGMLKFQIFCFFGTIINYYVSYSLYNDFENWSIAILVGSFTGAVLNYVINNQFTWKKYS